MSTAGRTILYIEDDPINRRLVQKLLLAEGYSVLLAEDGLKGLDLARREHPDLVLMDLNMPGLDGREVTTRLKALPDLADVPVVALTADVTEGVREKCLAAGCSGYIAKPVDVDTFGDQVSSYLDGKREILSEREKTERLGEYAQYLVARMETKVRELDEANRKLTANLQQVAQARDEALEASAMKTAFLQTMSHEMRTPLNAIIGFSQFLRDSNETGSDQSAEALEAILSGGHHLLELIVKALDLSAIEARRFDLFPAPFAVFDIVQQVIREHGASAAQKGLSLQTKACEGLLGYGDPKQIRRVLNFIVDNAVSMTDQGSIEIRCQLLDKAAAGSVPWIERLRAAGRGVLVSVKDSGRGIPTQDHDKIFSAFRQVDGSINRHHEGVGLSLALAKQIVLLHDGELWFESEEGQGTTFYILLPLPDESS